MTPHRVWPAERFYWAEYEVPAVRRAGELPPGLLTMLAEDAPADAAGLHAVCFPLAGGRLAVCAAERAALDELDPCVRTLSPESIPTFIESAGIGPDEINLLVGAYEPAPIRKRRFARHALAAAALLLCGALVCTGLHRRAAHWETRTRFANDEVARIAAAISPVLGPADLAHEAARLRRSREALAKAVLPPDASAVLASVLHAWPADVPSRPQSLSVTPSGVSISVALEGDAAAFLTAFAPPEGWRLDEPRLNSSENVTRLSLHLRRSPPGAAR